MAEGSTTVTLSTRPRKRSISNHRHSTADTLTRTSLIKTKIQKIDGQYKASSTCPTVHEPTQAHSSDDPDELLIVATVPPLVQNRSKYRTRQDVYDDETAEDQQSNSSSVSSSPIATPPSPTPQRLMINTTSDPVVEEKIDQIVVETSMASTPLTDELTVQPEPVVTPKKLIDNKSTLSVSSSAISIETTKPR